MPYVRNQSNDVAISDHHNWALPQMKADWDAYFNSSQPGDVLAWAGGTLRRDADGMATYTGQVYRVAVLCQKDYNFADAAMQAPALGEFWQEQYGYNPGTFGYNITHGLDATGTVVLGASKDWEDKIIGPSAEEYWADRKAKSLREQK